MPRLLRRKKTPDRVSAALPKGAVALVRKAFGTGAHVVEIAGDASTRRFYRVRSKRRTAVLMLHPDPLRPSSPLYSNHRILESIGAPVPRILASDPRAGAVLVEDCGDTTLQKRLLSGRKKEEGRRFYRRACDLIVRLQTRAASRLGPGDFASRNALDVERFLFELDHFHRHFIVSLRGMRPNEADEALLRAFFVDLAQDCDRMPLVYCHRDFQSRNLMVQGGRLRLIDFQDARMGPYTYDAASLLRDSSLDLDEDLVEEMLGYLAARLQAGPEEFRRDFDRMALQRNIKDLGTFGYMATVRGLTSYLDFVPRTIRSVKRTLLRTPRFHFVHTTLERYVLSYSS